MSYRLVRPSQALSMVALLSLSTQGFAQDAPAGGRGQGPTGTDTGAQQGSGAPSFIITPTISVGESYLDNINLDPKGSERSDFVSTITPALRISDSTERLQLGVNYSPQAVIYARSQSPSKIEQQLQGSVSAAVIPEYFFFDSSASIDRQFISNKGPLGNSSLTTNDNLQSVSAVDASPYLKLHFEDLVQSETRYRYDNVSSGGDSVAPTSTSEFSETLSSGPIFGRLSWNALLKYSFTDRLDAARDSLANTSERDRLQELDASYQLYQAFSVLGTVGYEKIIDPTAFGLSGPVWNGGFRYQPRSTASVKVTFGRHYHQPDTEVEVKYDLAPTIHLDANYTKSAQMSQNFLSNNLSSQLATFLADALTNLTSCPAGSSSILPSATGGCTFLGSVNSPFGLNSGITLDTAINVSLEAKRGRNDFTLNVYDERQTGQQGTTANEHVTGTSFFFGRDLQPTLHASLNAGYYKAKYLDNSGRKDDVYSVGLAVNKNLSDTLSAGFSFSRFDTESNIAANTVVSDVVLITVAKSF